MIEIWPTEAWNGYFQDAAAGGLPLYPAADGLVGNNYPPLSFYAIGLLGKAIGIDNLFVGRAVSVLALLAVAIEIFLSVGVLVGGRAGAAIGALWYLALMAHNQTTDVACANKVVCRLAGKPFMADEFKLEELVLTGKATEADVASTLDARHISPFPNVVPSGADASFSQWWRKNR